MSSAWPVNRDQKAALVFLGIGTAISLASLPYEVGSFEAPGTGFTAFWAGIVVSVLAIIGWAANWKKPGEAKPAPLIGALWHKPLITLAALLGYVLLLHWLGFFICTFLLIFVLRSALEKGGWRLAGLWSLGAAVAAQLIFKTWLKAQLPSGLLGSIF